MAAEGLFEPGDRLGDYEILAELGGGGMGRVYRARDLTLDRVVALKTLAPHLRHDEKIVQRFLKEARAAARLNHPNIVQIYDFGKEGDTYYLAMEYVEGDSLGGLLKRGPIAEAEALRITRLACRALAVAHAGGLVHRDIKPDNLMLMSTGEVKLVDLGVAKQLGDDQSLTQTGQALGTPNYVSPEQIRAAEDIDGRADLYSLGATLYHLVTGQPPFRGTSSAMVMSMHLYQPFEDPRTLVPGLSQGLEQVLRKMMAKERDERYANAQALDSDLYQLQRGQEPGLAREHTEAATTSPGGRTSAFASPPPLRPSAGSHQPTPNPSAAATPSGSQPGASVTSEKNLKALETELAKHVGPLARILVKRAAKSAPSLHQLIVELEKEIPGDKARRTFRAATDTLR